MKTCLLFIVSVIASCSQIDQRATEVEIEAAAKRIAGKHLPSSAQLASRLTKESDGIWRVQVHQIDPRHTNCGCILFVPGTGREMLFKPSGRLISNVALH
ncbi:hypothetical protein [Prosthecobacter sp.]|uniref:hypothetical protein n=1 Tax=Prosthecobacter sp. TaxID=1965333 RepID=UPI001D30C0D0|nr:hypothetical protein [Prosthecobacter sp.]MCB1278517.1 hypothetical protein [Prosthecobacter sp.]